MNRRLFVALTAAILVVVGAGGYTATAWAWNFKTDKRTCRYDHRGGDFARVKIRTNEDECMWPREIAATAINYGTPRYLDLGLHRYKRTYLRWRSYTKFTAHYREPYSGTWFKISASRCTSRRPPIKPPSGAAFSCAPCWNAPAM